jgi:hypothetical protein
MKLQKKMTLDDIVNYAKSQYHEEFSTKALSRHMRSHCEEYIKAAQSSSRVREQVIRSEISKDIEAAQLLTSNLKMCAEVIGSLAKKMQEQGELDPELEKSILRWLAETRQTIDLALKFHSRLQESKSSSSEDLMPKIEKALEILPEDLASKFLEALERQ